MTNFRPYDGEWIVKEHTLKQTAGDVAPGDIIQVTSGGNTVELGTSTATAIIGISLETIANDTSGTNTIRVLEPINKKAEMIGPVTSGAIAAGRTDSGRGTDLNDHEGVAADTDTHHHLTIVKGTVATTDGTSTEGEGVFRIAQTVDNISSF